MLMMTFGPVTLYALFAAIAGALGFAASRKPRLDGHAYLTQELMPRLRQPVRYALTHPVESLKRLWR